MAEENVLQVAEDVAITQLDSAPTIEATDASTEESTETTQVETETATEENTEPPIDNGQQHIQGNFDSEQDEQEVESTTETAADDAAAVEEEVQETEDYYTFEESLSEATNGLVRSSEELEAIVKENQNFKAQVQPELEGGAKQLYDFAQKFQGNEIGGARKMLHALSLDVDKMSPKDTLFESFMLDERNADLTRERAHEIFEEHYTNKYSDVADNILSARDLELATRDATSSIQSLQEKYAQAESETPVAQASADQEAAIQEIGQNVDNVMSQFDGIEFPTDESEENFVSFSVDTDEMRDELALAQKNSGEWLQSKINGFTDENGNFNYGDFQSYMTGMVFHEKIAQTMYQQGLVAGKEGILKEIKNPANKPTPDATDGQGQQSTQDKVDEAWGNAMNNF
jgi:hypothetical protein